MSIVQTVSSSQVQTGFSLQCQQSMLARALSLVGKAVSPNSTHPILKMILFTLHQGYLHLAATNLEIGIDVGIAVQAEGKAVIAVPADIFTRTIHHLPDEELRVTCDLPHHLLKIECTGSITRIRTQDAEEFPALPRKEGASTLSVDASVLRLMISQVAFSADDSHRALSGVYTSIQQSQFTMVACSSFQLAERILPLPDVEMMLPPILIPAKNLCDLVKILPVTGKVSFSANENRVLFHYEQKDMELTFSSRLLVESYPAYQQIFTLPSHTQVVVETALLTDAMNRAAIFATDMFHTVRLEMRQSGQQSLIQITAEDGDRGDHISVIPAIIQGENLSICFPLRYLKSSLEHLMSSQQISMHFHNAQKPVIMKPVEEPNYTNVVMAAYPFPGKESKKGIPDA